MEDGPTARRRSAGRGARRGTLLDSLPRTPAAPRAPTSAERADAYPSTLDDDAAYADQIETPGRLTLPSMPRMAATRRGRAAKRPAPQPDQWDAHAAYIEAESHITADPFEQDFAAAPATGVEGYGYGYVDNGAPVVDDYASDGGDPYDEGYEYETRARARSLARPLTPALPHYNDPDDLPLPAYPPLPADSAPELAAFRPARAPQRVRLDTRALTQAARSPWTIVRLALALTAMLLALMNTPGQMGEQSQPLMTAHAEAGLAPGTAVTNLIKPETQLMRPDLYDNYAQFQNWGGAACSAAALSEILTAYGVPHATIGHEIDELGRDISPYGGLLNRHGFAVVAAKHNLRADESTSLTYNQIVYISQQLGMPVIVNVRISYGYYHFFDGGHFLTVVGGDAQGLKIVDSSEYYLHYLPKDVFYQMFTGYTAAIVPATYQYTLPNN